MTATLLPFAASSLIALSAGTPASGAVMADEPAIEQSVDASADAESDAHRGRSSRDGGSRSRSNAHSDAPRGASSHAARPAQAAAPAHREPAHREASHRAPAHRAPPPPPPHHARPAPPPPRGVVVVHTRPAPPPPPARAVVVHDDAPSKSSKRGLDRNNSFSVGLRTGSYLGGYENGASYGDFGLGLAARYRPTESLGFELAYSVHSDSWNDEADRNNRPLSASAELFAFPWAAVSPYAIGGLTYTSRDIDEELSVDARNTETVETESAMFGPHLGVGIEFAIGDQASLNFEGRATQYLNLSSDDQTSPAALQGTMGLNWYF